ncbi:MAG TPA: putative transporter [Tepidisphaeraceae bacterium]|jgi:putative transport protein|nr:putative transporter [Tepidisphaeraceae bacterium]
MLLSAATLSEHSVAMDLAMLSLAVTFGLALGAIRFRGMRLGISAVLFSSLLFGQFGLSIDPSVLRFLRDFALIIFIYSLGLQVGPGFLTSLRNEGLRLNLLSIAVLGLGALMTAGVVKLFHLPHASSAGIYTGAFTTTPGLAAGQDALRQKMGNAPAADSAITMAALAYSVSYPFGVVGPILVIVCVKRLFGIDIAREKANLAAAEEVRRPPIEPFDFEVTEPSLADQKLRDHPLIHRRNVIFSRLLRNGTVSVPTGDTVVQVGDIYRAVGPRNELAEVVAAMGRPATVDMGHVNGDVQRIDLLVTRTAVLRRSLAELDLIRRYGVTVARVERAGVKLVPNATLRLAFADRVSVVGPAAGLKLAESELGNSPDTLNRPQLVPIFVGIVLGVIVGTIPLPVPGLHMSLRIGLAGGPLLAAIILSQWGNLGSVVWYMPVAANALFRDFGLAVFLACVGLDAGAGLWQQIVHGGGLRFMMWGAVITFVPVFAVACYARAVFRMNFVMLSGWISGAMTSSPSLAFANELAGSDAPAVAYAAVAPLGILAPILFAEFLSVI